MVSITDVYIISIDKSEDSWAIEGEVVFEEDLSSDFQVTYNLEDDELEDLVLDVDPGRYSKSDFKQMVVKAAIDYED